MRRSGRIGQMDDRETMEQHCRVGDQPAVTLPPERPLGCQNLRLGKLKASEEKDLCPPTANRPPEGFGRLAPWSVRGWRA